MRGNELLRLQKLRVGFTLGGTTHEVLHGLDLTVHRGEAIGLVGESGSGKSVAALSVLQLLGRNGAITGGEILFDDVDLAKLPMNEIRRLRGKEISMIFQDPSMALNPAFTVGTQMRDVIKAHRNLVGPQIDKEAMEVLERVGFADPPRVMRSYSHELSGGMRQRAMIAMAIACKPRLVLADEPTTALDVTVQAQIVELLRGLVKEMDLALVFITHNLDLMAELCDRAVVLYQGRVMESGNTVALFEQPAHPYTQLLFDSIPRLEQAQVPAVAGKSSKGGPGWQQANGTTSPGCPFAPRCPRADNQCGKSRPQLVSTGRTDAACWHAMEQSS
jgi:peptide/nickel transport system ATP-binding protein